MDNKSNYKYLLSDLTALKGVGIKTTNLLKKKKINNIFDLLWKLPKSYTDRSLSSKIKDLRIGEVQTITIIPKKYSFPRVRNLPNRVLCSDETINITDSLHEHGHVWSAIQENYIDAIDDNADKITQALSDADFYDVNMY